MATPFQGEGYCEANFLGAREEKVFGKERVVVVIIVVEVLVNGEIS